MRLFGLDIKRGGGPSEFKASSTFKTIISGLGLGQIAVPKPDYLSLAKASYQKNVLIYSLVNKIARSAGTVPWVLMERPSQGSGKGWKTKRILTESMARKASLYSGPNAWAVKKALDVTEIEDHPLLTLLQKPNGQMSQAEYLEYLISYWLISGNAYEEFVSLSSGTNVPNAPLEMWPLRPDRMEIIPTAAVKTGMLMLRDGTIQKFSTNDQQLANNADSLVFRYDYRVGGQIQPFQSDSIIHHKFFHPTDDFYGLSPLLVSARAWQTDNLANDWNYALLKNEGRPSGALVIPTEIGDEAYQRMKLEMKDVLKGGAIGEPLLLEGGMKWEPFGLSPLDLDWEGGKNSLLITLCQVYNTPPEIAGSPDHRTFNSMPEARKAWYNEAVLPLLSAIRDSYNRALVPLYGDQYYLDYDRDQIDALQEERNQVWSRVKNADHLTLQEKRQATGFDDLIVDDPDVVPLLEVPTKILDLMGPAGTVAFPQTAPAVGDGSTPASPAAGQPFGRGTFSGTKAQDLQASQDRTRKGMRKKLSSIYRALGKKLGSHIAAEVKK